MSKPSTQCFAAGGPVLGRAKSFLKEPDRFRDSQFKKGEGSEEDFGKGSGKGSVSKGKDKSLTPIKPRK